MTETVDHAEIRAWAQQAGGRPQVFDNPSAGSDRVGIRVDFAGGADDAFASGPNAPRDVSWDEFFRLFDQMGLTFLYEEANGTVADKSELYRFGRRSAI